MGGFPGAGAQAPRIGVYSALTAKLMTARDPSRCSSEPRGPGSPRLILTGRKQRRNAKTHLETHQPLCICLLGRVRKWASRLHAAAEGGWLPATLQVPSRLRGLGSPHLRPSGLWPGRCARGTGPLGPGCSRPAVGTPGPAVAHLGHPGKCSPLIFAFNTHPPPPHVQFLPSPPSSPGKKAEHCYPIHRWRSRG